MINIPWRIDDYEDEALFYPQNETAFDALVLQLMQIHNPGINPVFVNHKIHEGMLFSQQATAHPTKDITSVNTNYELRLGQSKLIYRNSTQLSSENQEELFSRNDFRKEDSRIWFTQLLTQLNSRGLTTHRAEEDEIPFVYEHAREKNQTTIFIETPDQYQTLLSLLDTNKTNNKYPDYKSQVKTLREVEHAYNLNHSELIIKPGKIILQPYTAAEYNEVQKYANTALEHLVTIGYPVYQNTPARKL